MRGAGQRMAEQAAAFDQRVDAPLGSERLAGDRRQIMELQQRLILHQRVARELAFEFVAEGKVADLPHAMDELDLAEAFVNVGIARKAEERRKAVPVDSRNSRCPGSSASATSVPVGLRPR